MSRRPNAPLQPPSRQQSWSPDILREEAWQRQKENHFRSSDSCHRLSKSVSEDDVDELMGCIELGFGFDSPKIDPKLSNTIPGLELFHAVNKQYNDHSLTRSSSSSSSSMVSDNYIASPTSIFDPADDKTAKKARLKQWAKVVACAVRQSHPPPSDQLH